MTDVGDVSFPTAAKAHRCEWCGEPIEKGEKHPHFVGKWDGEFQNWRMHFECYESADKDELNEGFMPYEHERPKTVAVSPPPEGGTT